MVRQAVLGMRADQIALVLVPLVDQLTGYPGFIAHASGPTADGYQMTEVWESQETHERWAREVLMPTLRRVGLGHPQPSTAYLTLDLYLTR